MYDFVLFFKKYISTSTSSIILESYVTFCNHKLLDFIVNIIR